MLQAAGFRSSAKSYSLQLVACYLLFVPLCDASAIPRSNTWTIPLPFDHVNALSFCSQVRCFAARSCGCYNRIANMHAGGVRSNACLDVGLGISTARRRRDG